MVAYGEMQNRPESASAIREIKRQRIKLDKQLLLLRDLNQSPAAHQFFTDNPSIRQSREYIIGDVDFFFCFMSSGNRSRQLCRQCITG